MLAGILPQAGGEEQLGLPVGDVTSKLAGCCAHDEEAPNVEAEVGDNAFDVDHIVCGYIDK